LIQVISTNKPLPVDISGFINEVHENHLTISFASGFKDLLEQVYNDERLLAIVRRNTNHTYKRQIDALKELPTYSNSEMINILFSNHQPPTTSKPLNDFNFFNKNLNLSQRQAVSFAINQPHVAALHGPPGTGKTTVLVEIVLQLISDNKKLLVCAPSNVAVDNLVSKLQRSRLKSLNATTMTSQRKMKRNKMKPPKLTRLQNVARTTSDDLVTTTLDWQVANSARDVISAMQEEIKDLNEKLTRKGAKNSDQIKAMIKEKRAIVKEEDKYRKQAKREILSSSDVILSTLNSAHRNSDLKLLGNKHMFDVVIIDECGQALEADCWVSLVQAHKCILAGDHLQLPPTVKSKRAVDEGLSVSLLERVINSYDGRFTFTLTHQYRMNQTIMDWSSTAMYGGLLVADSSVQNHLLSDLDGVDDNEVTSQSMLLIDTQGCNMFEEV